MRALLILLLLAPLSWVQAEVATYGDVNLTGLARENWGYQPMGLSGAMVCNVNGPDGYLSVRSCASTQCTVNRSLKRLAILQVHTGYRQGHWIYVTTAYRNHTPWGQRLSRPQNLDVQGWAHDSYLCDYLD